MERIEELNKDPTCHGILVQSPIALAMGESSPPSKFAGAIDPKKDVDGLHPVNLGRLACKSANPAFYPCTPLGIIAILQHYGLNISGQHAVILGRSEIVGMPTALLLNRLDATVTLCHSRTEDLVDILRGADLVVAAIGRANFVQAEWLKPGAIVIDVGINRIQNRLVGDVDFERVSRIASAITPVPGGVGPMTVAMLVQNLFRSALLSRGLTTTSSTDVCTY